VAPPAAPGCSGKHRQAATEVDKPEPLKYLASGMWSRRLTQEHRLVYLARDDRIVFLQPRYRYRY